MPHEVVRDELATPLERVEQGDRPVGPDQCEVGVHLDHGQAPSGRGDRVALPGVRLLPDPQRVQFGLEGRPVDGRGARVRFVRSWRVSSRDARALFDDVGVGGAEHVQVIEYRSRVVRPVHGGELGAAAAARSPAQGLESRSAEHVFRLPILGPAAILGRLPPSPAAAPACAGSRAAGRSNATPPRNPWPRVARWRRGRRARGR